MSTQLILTPQYSNGQFNAVSTNPNEFVVNGISFSNLDTASSFDSTGAVTITDTLTNAPPTVPNTWYRFRSQLAGVPALPTVVSGNLSLNSVVFTTVSGIYQRLTGLTIGQSYSIRVKMQTTGTGNIITGAYNGAVSVTSGPDLSPATTLTIVETFTANATDNTILVAYGNSGNHTVVVETISVLPTGITPTGNIDLSNGEVICDLYEEEDLPITLSVDDFKNVAEKVQSYSKAFKLPGTKRNNRIFDHIFEVTRSTEGLAFNPYLKTQCKLKQHGFILFEGYLRLIDIQDQEGEISYNVNLYSDVIALADVLSQKTFSMLNFGELTHSYDKNNIKNSWNETPPGITYTIPSDSGFRTVNDTVKYPFCDWTHEILMADGFTGSGATLNRLELTSLDQAFRPFIQVKYIIQRIFQDSPFTFESAFFDTSDFKKLYMDFNWGELEQANKGKVCPGASTSTTAFAAVNTIACGSMSNTAASLGWDVTNNKLVSPVTGQTFNVTYRFDFTSSASGTFQASWIHRNSSGVILANIDFYSVSFVSGQTVKWDGNYNITMSVNDTLEPVYKTDVAGIVAQVTAYGGVLLQADPLTITTNTFLQSLRGELGQWDFLKGLFTMFNLVSVPDKSNPSNIIIEPYKDVFASSNNPASPNFFDNNSKQLNWTDKIDITEIKLTPLTELNKKTIFKFTEDDDDYAFMNYKKSVFGHLYGSKVYDASGFTILEGQAEIVAEPFAATVVKPYMPQFPGLITPALYSYDSDEGTTSGFDNSPRIMFNNGVVNSGTTYFIPDYNGLSSENQPEFLQFSHLSEIPTTSTTNDFHFGECQLIQPVGNAVTNNLFNTYWLPYFNELYDSDTRIMTIKVNLQPGDITTFNFYDTVIIKNREYRVNTINYQPNSLATVEFILIP